MSDENAIVIEAWNTVLFEKFCRFRHVLVAGLSKHSDELLTRYPHRRGARVLDIGCGFGDSTLEIARQVGVTGRAVGVDCSRNFVESARRDASLAKVDNASFFVADVQSEDLKGPYDCAFSRFGTMFFNLPGAALRNIRLALAPGATLRMIVWRKREDNPWLHEAEKEVRNLVRVVSPEETDQVHCGPGPFSMSGPDMVSDMLRGVGYDHVAFERFDAEVCIGRDIDDAVEFAMALGPAGEIMRLAAEDGQRRAREVDAALRGALKSFERNDGVWAASSTWFVSARNPG
jgi:SAM-dependent methyltransferase